MLDRNRRIKTAPERWQESSSLSPTAANVIITCEERCFDSVVDDLFSRGGDLNRPVHVINMEIKDNHEEALVAGRAMIDLCKMIEEAQDVEAEMDSIIERQMQRHPHQLLHTSASCSLRPVAWGPCR